MRFACGDGVLATANFHARRRERSEVLKRSFWRDVKTDTRGACATENGVWLPAGLLRACCQPFARGSYVAAGNFVASCLQLQPHVGARFAK